MASKKTQQLRDMSDSDLTNEHKEISARYQKLRFDHAIKGLDNPIALREIRRDIARLKTEIRKRNLEGRMTTQKPEKIEKKEKANS